jgi:CRISPR system Cascade subunit CasC
MTEPRFIQIHWLASYPGTLLNRDDAGVAKTLPFGGAVRTRISSQCLKRRWRKAEDAMNIGAIEGIETAERSREHVERQIVKGLAEETGKSAEIEATVGIAFTEALYGVKGKDRRSRQALLLGWPEIRYMRNEARALIAGSKDAGDAEARCQDYFEDDGIRRVFRAVRGQCALPGGFEAALFGRMVTSDPEANIEAALSVAHAITVHRAEKELDFLTVVDDLKSSEDSAGSAGVFDSELTSGLYYGYAVIHVPTLVSNLAGVPAQEWLGRSVDRRLAGEVASRLIHLVATAAPGAKKGSTAPFAYAEMMLIEAGIRQPRTLANAFRKPVELRGSVYEESLQALGAHLSGLDAAYGGHEVRSGFSIADGNAIIEAMGGKASSLEGVANFARRVVETGQA